MQFPCRIKIVFSTGKIRKGNFAGTGGIAEWTDRIKNGTFRRIKGNVPFRIFLELDYFA